MTPAGVVLVLVVAALTGGAVGSFAGVVATRGWSDSLGGRSHCDSCGRTLEWYELVPLVSYPVLRGRCRTCGTRIGLGVYAWEAGGAALGCAAAVVVLALSGRL